MIAVPHSFAAMPRWWGDEPGRVWVADLPAAVERRCRAWGLAVDGEPLHGTNALVVPVRRARERFMLRLAPPGDDVAAEVRALTVWRGRGVVELIDADVAERTTLLERLDPTRSLTSAPLAEAVEVLAGLTRVLAVEVEGDVPSTAALAADARDGFEAAWEGLGRPSSAAALESAVTAAGRLASAPSSSTAVDGDLHFAQALAGGRAPWTVVDPVLLRGDPEYDLGRVLWSRLDEVDSDDAVVELFDRFVRVAAVPSDRAVGWVRVRSMSYLLWGLQRGLTLDPPKCLRLLHVFG